MNKLLYFQFIDCFIYFKYESLETMQCFAYKYNALSPARSLLTMWANVRDQIDSTEDRIFTSGSRCHWDNGFTEPPPPKLDPLIQYCDHVLVAIRYAFEWSDVRIERFETH